MQTPESRETGEAAASSNDDITVVHALRRRWKPTKNGPAAADEFEPIRIRLHRALSWMQRVEDLFANEDFADDAFLIYEWIAFNSLYGRWNTTRQEPMSDRDTMDIFLRRILAADADGAIRDVLDEHKKLVESIAVDEYLNKFFWQDPNERSARQAANRVHKLREWYREDRLLNVLDEVINRIYLGRCQLVQGAATFDSALNRDAVRRCAMLMAHLLPAMITVIIDHAWSDDWGDLCYTPLR
ncbi:MAG: hypothetical protein KC983_04210 [Phycisphaerales bacterium]|nr:hypothetical protein [Phycisphaerales bacterium]